MFKVNGVEVEDTFAEAFQMWACRILITASSEKWALKAAENATGFGTTIILCPCEAGIEKVATPAETPDGRPGLVIQIYHRSRLELKAQMVRRVSQCILTCPTTAAFNALPDAKRRVRVGNSIRRFGDGFEAKAKIRDRLVWRIPVMDGDFFIENRFGVKKAVAGGMFLILARSWEAGLKAAERAVEGIRRDVEGVILPFPGGICRSGSKVGSLKYKLPASINHPFCPTLRGRISDTAIPEGANGVYEIVVDGLTLDVVKKAMALGIKEASKEPGVVRITAANYGGKLGPYKIYLRDIIQLL